MKAYLVLGPERSGTRLIARILVAAGCYGDDGHDQRADHAIPAGVSPIVWRRSVPHNRDWPDVPGMAQLLREKGYQVQAVVMSRDWFAMAQSQQAEGLAPDLGTAYCHLQRAYPFIFYGLEVAGVPFLVITYEHLVQRSGPVIGRLVEYLGLPALNAASVEVYDANVKWYAGQDGCE